jgi:hypothetical protein
VAAMLLEPDEQTRVVQPQVAAIRSSIHGPIAGHQPPAMPPGHSTRNAPTITNRPLDRPFAMPEIVHHPFFGVGLVVVIALVISIVAVLASFAGCFGRG